MFLLYFNILNAIADLEAINLALGFPDGNGTVAWDMSKKSVDEDIWFFRKPNIVMEFNNDEEVEFVIIKEHLPDFEFQQELLRIINNG